MKCDQRRSRGKRGRTLRQCLVGLSAVAGVFTSIPSAAVSSAGGSVAGAWRQITSAATTYEILANATACVRLLVEYGAAFIHRVWSWGAGALQTMIPLYLVVVVVVCMSLLKVFLKQAIAHVVLKGMEKRLAPLAGDKTVIRSPGIGAAAFVLPPSMDSLYPECRAWFAMRVLGAQMREHPIDAAGMLRRIQVSTASVHDLRCILRLLRKSWLFVDERALLDFIQMRTFDLRDFADTSGDCAGDMASTTESGDPLEGGEIR